MAVRRGGVNGAVVDFLLQVDRTPGRTVVTVGGELDIATCVEVERTLRAAIARSGDVVVDLAGATFIDSTALQVLATASAALQRAGRRLVVATPSDIVVRAIDLCGVRDLLGVQPGQERPDDRAP